MLRFLYILMCAVLLVVPDAAAQKTSAKSIKQQQKAAKQEIKKTNKKIKDNTAETARSLNRLNLIEAEMVSQKKTIDSIAGELAAVNKKLALVEDSISSNERDLARLKDNYLRAVRSVRARSSSMDRLLFIFSAETFHQAYRRMRYLQQFSEWRGKQAVKINETQGRLQMQKDTLAVYKNQRAIALDRQNAERLALKKKQQEQSKEVAALKKEGKALQKVLAEQKRKAAKLEEALNKLIAEEERKAALRAKEEEEKRRKAQKAKEEAAKKKEPKTDKPVASEVKKTAESGKPSGYSMTEAERTLSGSFESNKGNLLFPVTGKYTIVKPFGRQRHPELKYVETDNGGIDIEVAQGSNARAVFDGKVSAVFRQDGFNTIVMVRHGNYLTIYVNLSEIYVANGDVVKAGQAIGKIFSDPDDENRTILHFEVRKEREKLNPQKWVR